MFNESFGPPQLAALLILLQRGFDDVLSRRNTHRLLEQGGLESGRDYYTVVAVTYLAWIAAIAFLIPPSAPVYAAALVAYLALQSLRYWVIWTLGRFWTHRIITLPGATVKMEGPFRLLRHPVYALTVAETLLMPLAFGQPAVALIFTAIWLVVVRYKAALEDAALAGQRIQGSAP
jgi:methyltransferase